jgi:hypothetical protein
VPSSGAEASLLRLTMPEQLDRFKRLMRGVVPSRVAEAPLHCQILSAR